MRNKIRLVSTIAAALLGLTSTLALLLPFWLSLPGQAYADTNASIPSERVSGMNDYITATTMFTYPNITDTSDITNILNVFAELGITDVATDVTTITDVLNIVDRLTITDILNPTATDTSASKASIQQLAAIPPPTGAPIANCTELQNMENDLGGSYYLANDIDCSATPTWNGGAGFDPIGTDVAPFTGVFDGQGHIITNLYINRSAEDYVGLFGYTSNEIKYVGLEGVNISGGQFVGALAGRNQGVLAMVNESYSTGSVNGTGDVGGLVGRNQSLLATVVNCYSIASVNGVNNVGGLIGRNQGLFPLVTNSYSAGSVNGTNNVGGLVGRNGPWALVGDSYYDRETSGQSDTGKGEPKTTAEMMQQTTFLGWDFTDTWDIEENATYPFFQWQVVGQPPIVGVAALYQFDEITSITYMDPQVEYAVKVTITDTNTLDDINEVIVTLFYDAAGNDPNAPGTSDSQTSAILTWTKGGSPEWDIAPSEASSSWSIEEANCKTPTMTEISGDWWFHFKPGKVATHSQVSDDWDIHAQATDAAADSDELYARDYEMNWYGEIAVNTGSVDWGTVDLGSDFGANVQTGISVTYICNGDYDQQVRTENPWSGSGISITLNTAGMPSASEFSLKADDTITLASAVTVSTTYTTIASDTQTGEAGNIESDNTLWLKIGPADIPAVTYSGTIYYQIAQ